MDDAAVRLECLRLAAGDLNRAQSFYGWLTGDVQVSLLITPKMIERELIRMTNLPCSVTEGVDGMFLIVISDRGKAVRFTDSERSMGMTDFGELILKPLVEKFSA